MAGAGDVNGDGYADFMIGAPLGDHVDPASEGAYVVLGASSFLPSRSLSDADIRLAYDPDEVQYPGDVAGAGDVDGDGFDDVLFGLYDTGLYFPTDVPSNATAILLRGGASPPGTVSVDDADVRLFCDRPGPIAAAGDADGDGLDDILVSDGYYGVWLVYATDL